MAASEIFAMTNPKDTCTAAALLWCRSILHGRPAITAALFDPKDGYLNTMMRDVGVATLDNDPKTQIGLAGLELVVSGDKTITSQQIADTFSATAPNIGIFWNSFHTMGYRYAHHDKQYFDNNYGLFKAKLTSDITAKMEDIRKTKYNSEAWAGYAIVKLPANRLRVGMK